MVVVPDATPVTVPLDEPMVALAGVLLAHVPPVVASVRVVDEPTHTDVAPLIEAGSGLIVTLALPSVPQHPKEDWARK